MTKVRSLLVLGAMLAAALVIAACGSDSSSSDSGGTIIRGTTDQPISYDPAGAYDLPSYDGIYSFYQNLLTIEPGGNKAVPEAAESCDFTDKDNKVFECTLRDGLKFSDGSDLTAEDVVFSFERNVKIADPNGASSLLANMKSIEAKDDETVVFNLKAAGRDLAAAADCRLVRDRPVRRLSRPTSCSRATRWSAPVATRSPTTSPASRPSWRRTTRYHGRRPGQERPGDHPVLRQGLGAEARGPGRRRRHRLPQPQPDRHRRASMAPTASAWSPATAPRSATWSSTRSSSPATTTPRSWRSARPSLRPSTASRSPTTSTTAPSSRSTRWSRRASSSRTRAFSDEYGEAPDVDAAKQTLDDAGVDTPVPLEVWWTPSHYGAAVRRRVRRDQAPARRAAASST